MKNAFLDEVAGVYPPGVISKQGTRAMVHSDSFLVALPTFARADARERRGASLIELLVVIAIIGTLIGIAIPAVQRVRDAAARTKCSNNLRQLGLALHQYHDTRNAFPPGLSNDRSNDPYPYLSWNARILPFLEQGALWSEIEQAYAADRNFYNVPPHIHRSTIVGAFICPTDSRVHSASNLGVAFTSYLGVEGTDQFSQNGVLFLDSAVRIVDITDGASNTLLAGERPPSATEIFGWWYAGWGQQQDGSAEMVLGAREWNMRIYAQGCPRGPYHFAPGRFDNPCDAFHFWSPHLGGANFLFADGSVRLLRYSADSILPALATRAGGDIADLP